MVIRDERYYEAIFRQHKFRISHMDDKEPGGRLTDRLITYVLKKS